MSSEKPTRSPGRPGLTYETVAAAADAIIALGGKVTNAAVYEQLGRTGSATTISKFTSQWQSQRPRVQVADIEIAPSVQREIANEIERHVIATSAELREQLAECVSTRDAITVESEERAALLADIEQQLTGALATTTEQSAALSELRVAEERERLAAGQLRIELAQARLRLEDLPTLRTELTQLRVDVSAARAESAGLVATLDATRDRLSATEQRAAAAVTAEHDAMLRAAALDAAAAAAATRADAAAQRADEATQRATASDLRAEIAAATAAQRADAAAARATAADARADAAQSKLFEFLPKEQPKTKAKKVTGDVAVDVDLGS